MTPFKATETRHPRNCSTRHIDTAIGRLSVHSTGEGPIPIVLWSSIFTDFRMYDALVAHLPGDFRVVCIDGPGHGDSTSQGCILEAEDLGRAMLTVMSTLGLGKAIVGGTSWGGIAAAEAALAAPENCAGVILMNTPMTIDGQSPGFKARFISFGARYFLRTGVFRQGIETDFFADATRSNAQTKPYLTHFNEALLKTDRQALAWAVRSVLAHGRPLIDRVGALSMPVLLVSGRDDAMCPLPSQIEAAKRVPKAEHVILATKHISAVDAPDDVTGAITRFAKSLTDLRSDI